MHCGVYHQFIEGIACHLQLDRIHKDGCIDYELGLKK